MSMMSMVSMMSLVSIGVLAERNRISVTEDDIKFNVDYFDETRLRPYRVVFWENGRNIFYFDSDGNIEVLRIGTERYRVSESLHLVYYELNQYDADHSQSHFIKFEGSDTLRSKTRSTIEAASLSFLFSG